MKFLSVLAIVLSVPALAKDGSCTPDYQLSYAKCDGSEIDHYEPRTRSAKVVKGGDTFNNPDSYCVSHWTSDLQKEYPSGSTAKGVSRIESYQDGWNKRNNLWCDYTVNVAVHKVVQDDTCPINGVTEMKDCYDFNAGSVYPANTDAIGKCLTTRPTSDGEAWKLAACLLDAYKAQTDMFFESDLPGDMYERIQKRLIILRNYATSHNLDALVQYISEGKKASGKK